MPEINLRHARPLSVEVSPYVPYPPPLPGSPHPPLLKWTLPPIQQKPKKLATHRGSEIYLAFRGPQSPDRVCGGRGECLVRDGPKQRQKNKTRSSPRPAGSTHTAGTPSEHKANPLEGLRVEGKAVRVAPGARRGRCRHAIRRDPLQPGRTPGRTPTCRPMIYERARSACSRQEGRDARQHGTTSRPAAPSPGRSPAADHIPRHPTPRSPPATPPAAQELWRIYHTILWHHRHTQLWLIYHTPHQHPTRQPLQPQPRYPSHVPAVWLSCNHTVADRTQGIPLHPRQTPVARTRLNVLRGLSPYITI